MWDEFGIHRHCLFVLAKEKLIRIGRAGNFDRFQYLPILTIALRPTPEQGDTGGKVCCNFQKPKKGEVWSVRGSFELLLCSGCFYCVSSTHFSK